MTILIAPNAFKDSLDVVSVAEFIANGLKRALPGASLILHPVADGGDGTLEAAGYNAGLKYVETGSRDPLNRELNARYAIFDNGNALIEMAKASGLHLLGIHERKAGITNSYGTGMLIADAMRRGCRKIFLGIGGTATVDAGTGILKALGFRFLDTNENDIGDGGFNLAAIREIILPENIAELRKTEIIILSDVTNPLLGPLGASHVFAPQKGATPGEVKVLEDAMNHFCRLVERTTGKDISSVPCGGAAGGTPAGLSAFLEVTTRSGAETILDLTNFAGNLEKADIVITGEGKLDSQTDGGKAPAIVAEKAKKAGKKVFFIGGQVPGTTESTGPAPFDAVFSISPGVTSLEESMKNTGKWLERTAFSLGNVLKAGEAAGRRPGIDIH